MKNIKKEIDITAFICNFALNKNNHLQLIK